MISKLHTAAVLLTVASLMSCAGNSDKDYIDKSIIPPAGAQTTATQPATAQNTAAMPAGTVPGNTTIVPGTTTPVNITPQTTSMNVNPQNNQMVTAPQMVQQAAQTVTAPGMNPPHGQPGHRCDISVGAPLNSKPNAPAAPTTISAQPPQQPAVTMKEVPNTVKTAPGMNPPHGEPNHRCDIAVGAPLNSKPATPAVIQTKVPPLLTAPKSDSTNK